MYAPTDDEVLLECDQIGEHAVRARLKAGSFANADPAWAWLLRRRADAHQQREERTRKYGRWSIYALWTLMAIALVAVAWHGSPLTAL